MATNWNGRRSSTAGTKLCSTALQWSTEPNGGFIKNTKPVVAVISDGPYSFRHAQRRDPNSLLNWMERIFACTKKFPRSAGEIFLPSIGNTPRFGDEICMARQLRPLCA